MRWVGLYLLICVAALAGACRSSRSVGGSPRVQGGQPEETVSELIERLGAEEPRSRDDAFDRLVEIGPEAIPHLRSAELSLDPEIASRARRIIRVIENPPIIVRIEDGRFVLDGAELSAEGDVIERKLTEKIVREERLLILIYAKAGEDFRTVQRILTVANRSGAVTRFVE